jgi:hypothetical protein
MKMNKDFIIGFLSCLCLGLVLNTVSCGRTLSRLGLGDQVLELPKDFQSVVSVSLHKEDNGDTVKDFTYITTEGIIRSVEYRDKPWHLEGSIRWKKSK